MAEMVLVVLAMNMKTLQTTEIRAIVGATVTLLRCMLSEVSVQAGLLLQQASWNRGPRSSSELSITANETTGVKTRVNRSQREMHTLLSALDTQRLNAWAATLCLFALQDLSEERLEGMASQTWREREMEREREREREGECRFRWAVTNFTTP